MLGIKVLICITVAFLIAFAVLVVAVALFEIIRHLVMGLVWLFDPDN